MREELDLGKVPSCPARHFSVFFQLPCLGLSLLLGAYLLFRLPKVDSQSSYLPWVMIWIASIGLWIACSARWKQPEGMKAPAPPQTGRRWVALWVMALTAVAFVLRAWRVDSIPFAFSGDEASFATQADLTIAGVLRNPFVTGHLSQPNLIFFLGGWVFRILGSNVFAARLPWAAVGAIAIPAAFLLVRRSHGNRMALLTAALLAVYHYHIHYSRLNIGNIADPLFGLLTLYFLDRALRGSARIDWSLAGCTCGFSLYFYTGARFTVILAAMVVAYELFIEKHRFFIRHKWRPLMAFLGFLVVAGPMLQFAHRYPDDFNGRINQMGIIQSGWLDKTAQATGKSKASIVWDQFRRAALAFNYYPDRTVWYGLRKPLLDPLFGAFFLLGLGYASLRILKPWRGDRTLFPMVFWCLGGMFLGGALTVDPPSSQRLVTLTVPACFFVAFGFDQVIRLAQMAFPHFLARWALSLGVLAFTFISMKTYFVEATGQRLYGGRHAEVATAIAPILNRAKNHGTIYFAGAPAVFWGFPTFPYLVKNAEAVDVMEPLEEPVPSTQVTNQRGAIYVFMPERASELEYVRATFPHGRKHEVFSPASKSTIAVLYEIPPAKSDWRNSKPETP